ncbi:HpcH/HpaI aldolase/citrate lyase family protein [Pseudarthrobacter sp. NPDC092419]|uniref:HpcH/HpaI aldolase family protein n=1 Tax=Pseudarthrobacter sp. NPDC092419 TaxID=3364414 RepID=UPI0037FA131E
MTVLPRPNRLKARLSAGHTAVGLSCALGSAQIAEEFAMAGFDFIYIDQQHGLTSQDTLIEMLRAIAASETTPLVRVAQNDGALIGQALDAGAAGVIVPMINTAEEAALAARACRYHPQGERSWGPIRARYGLGADPATVNREVLCLVMIETVEALNNLEDIITTPGIDGVYIGPADLGVSLGGQPLNIEHASDPHHLRAIARIRQTCLNNNKIVGITGDPEKLTADGFNLITAALDFAIIRKALDQIHRPTATAAAAQLIAQTEIVRT